MVKTVIAGKSAPIAPEPPQGKHLKELKATSRTEVLAEQNP
jgi:hypothetical protein